MLAQVYTKPKIEATLQKKLMVTVIYNLLPKTESVANKMSIFPKSSGKGQASMPQQVYQASQECNNYPIGSDKWSNMLWQWQEKMLLRVITQVWALLSTPPASTTVLLGVLQCTSPFCSLQNLLMDLLLMNQHVQMPANSKQGICFLWQNV